MPSLPCFAEAIYSDELTGVTDSSGESEGGGLIQRLPYFILVKRVYDERHEQMEELKEQLDIVKKRSFLCPDQYIIYILVCLAEFPE